MKPLVLAEKLKEEIGGQKVRAAVFHTFNFDPEFFENYLLPLFLPDIPFGDNIIQNTILWKKFQNELPPVTIYCDFHAKSQKGINLDYLVRAIDVPKHKGRKPNFHPKHTFVLLEDWSLLVFVGSNNLTESGWCSNLEGISFFRLENKVNFPRTFKDQLKQFNRGLRDYYFNENFDNEDSWADALIDRFFRSTGYTDEVDTLFFDTRQKPSSNIQDFSSFLEYIKLELNDNVAFQKVEVISPYYSPSISLFQKLKEITKCDDISFSIPFEGTGYAGLEEDLFRKVQLEGMKWCAISNLKDAKAFRFNHSKIYRLVGEEKVFLIVGSVNFTEMAWKGVDQGGNYESAILYFSPKETYQPILENCSLDNLIFAGNPHEEKVADDREDVYHIEFIIDWSAKVLYFYNHNPEAQKGYIVFDTLPTVSINYQERTIPLSDELLELLSSSPIIKVKPSHKSIHFYYYPIHHNIEAKPLPPHINLNDTELLQLWLDLDDAGDDKAATLRIIDKYIDRITDEAGEVKTKELDEIKSTLNFMASHLQGLIKLHKRLFPTSKKSMSSEMLFKMRAYYLLTNNVDTLIGYRNLLADMDKKEKLNQGFYWLLLKIIETHFYKYVRKKDFKSKDVFEKIELVQSDLNEEIKSVAKKINKGSLTNKHLNWLEKMLKHDFKRS